MKTKSLLAKTLVVLAIAVGFLATIVPQANAATPCCDITKIDTRTGVVTAQDRTTGHTFQFTASPAVLQKLKVGQGVYANYKTRQLSLDGRTACCNIVNMGGAAPTTPKSPAGGRAGNQIAPVDDVTTSPNQVIPPNDAKIGSTQVSPPNNFTKSGNQISPPSDAKVGGNQVIPPEGGRVGSNQVNPPACCAITSIDEATGVVTAIDKTAGHSFQFTASPSAQQNLKVGQPVYANFKSKQVSIDGRTASGDILSVVSTSTAGTRRGNITPRSGLAPMAASGQTSGPSGGKGIQLVYTRTVDPCSLGVSAAELKTYASGGISGAFPYTYNKNGDVLTMYDPRVEDVTCSPLHLRIHTALHYKKTRGLIQFQSIGSMTFESAAFGSIRSTAPSDASVTFSNFQSAQLCLDEIYVDELNLKDIPNWLDNSWMRAKLNEHLVGKEKCSDISAVVSLLLQGGEEIPPTNAASTPKPGITVPNQPSLSSQKQASGPTMGTAGKGSTILSTKPIQPRLLTPIGRGTSPSPGTDVVARSVGKQPAGSAASANTTSLKQVVDPVTLLPSRQRVIDAATAINGTSPSVPVLQTITLGSFNGQDRTFGWDPQILEVYPPNVPSYKNADEEGYVQPHHLAVINSFNLKYEIGLYNAPGFQVSLETADASGKTVSVRATVDPASHIASVSFHPYSIRDQKIVISNGSGSSQEFVVTPVLRPQLGAFVVPHLLLGIVYEPPGSASNSTWTLSSTSGRTVGFESTGATGIVNTVDTGTLVDSIHHVADAASGAVGWLGDQGWEYAYITSNGDQVGIGDVLSGFSLAAQVYDVLMGSTTTTNKTITAYGQSGASGWSVAVAEGYSTGAHKYPGQGDKFVFLDDVLFVYAVIGGRVQLAPVAYTQDNSLTIEQLQAQLPTLASQWSQLDLVLNPQAATTSSGSSSALGLGFIEKRLPPVARMAFFKTDICYAQGCDPSQGCKQVSLSDTQYSSAGTSRMTTQSTEINQKYGLWDSIIGNTSPGEYYSTSYETTTENWQQEANETSVALGCPDLQTDHYVKIYLDNAFGTFVSVLGPEVPPEQRMRPKSISSVPNGPALGSRGTTGKSRGSAASASAPSAPAPSCRTVAPH